MLHFSDATRWLFSVQNGIDQSTIKFKFLLPLTPLPLAVDPSSQHYNYQSIPITSSRILYYQSSKSFSSLANTDPCIDLRQMKFPQAYSFFLKDLSRLIKPTTSSHLSMDLMWELMPDIDEQMNIPVISHIIPDIWAEIGKKYRSYHLGRFSSDNIFFV